MDIIYYDDRVQAKYIRLGVEGNNQVDVLVFVLNKVTQDGIRIEAFKPFVKFRSEDGTYIDKDARLERLPENEDDSAHFRLRYVLQRKTTSFPSVEMQLQFEDLRDEDVRDWQTESVFLLFDRTVAADRIIEDRHPAILLDHERRITEVEAAKKADAVVTAETHFGFPPEGMENRVYIATKYNRVYRWDAAGHRYVTVGSDYREVQVIDGGNLT